MKTARSHKSCKGWMIAAAVILLLGIAGLMGVAGCGDKESAGFDGMATTTTYWRGEEAATATTAAYGDAGSPASEYTASYDISQSVGGTLAALQAGADQKIIMDAQLSIEVEAGKFQTAFDQALLLADRYGGYVLSSNSSASGDEDIMKSGTIAIRIPAISFDNALSDAGKLGEVKSQYITTEDVTEEYVDIEARITNSEAHVASLLSLLAQAKTVDEILQVQQVLTSAQAELESLKGRLRFLDEHTSYSTLTLSIYETGVEVVTEKEEWGVITALKDALHNFVNAVNKIIRGLGVLIPVLIVLGIIAYVVYLIVRAVIRRNRRRAQALQQPYQQQGWQQPLPAEQVQAAQAPQAYGPGAQAGEQAADQDKKGK